MLAQAVDLVLRAWGYVGIRLVKVRRYTIATADARFLRRFHPRQQIVAHERASEFERVWNAALAGLPPQPPTTSSTAAVQVRVQRAYCLHANVYPGCAGGSLMQPCGPYKRH